LGEPARSAAGGSNESSTRAAERIEHDIATHAKLKKAPAYLD